jgi:Mg2+ and Co2+ transporter CorA
MYISFVGVTIITKQKIIIIISIIITITAPQNPGPIFSSTPIYVTKSTICKSLNCALRDLRIIDQFSNHISSGLGGTGSSTIGSASGSGSGISTISTSGFSSRYAGPAFLARRNCVIVNVGHVRAIVMRDQVIIFIPCEQQSPSQQNDGTIMSSTNSVPSTNANGSNGDVMQTINNLVEALVTHLNSIYHSSHHLVVEEKSVCRMPPSSSDNDGKQSRSDNSGVYLASRYDTSMGQQWGSGWYQQQKQSPPPSQKDSNKRRKGNKDKRQRQNQPEEYNMPITPSAKAPPFELVVIEALLGHVCSHESSKASHLIQNAQDVLSGITYTDNSSSDGKGKKKDAFLEMQRKLGELLPLKNKVDELEAKCSEVASAIAEVLKNDEDMAAMRLSEIAALRDLGGDDLASSVDELLLDEGDPYNLHVEVELLFEDYLLQMDEVLHSLRSVQSSITNTEEVVEIELDLLRNRIMRYEMLLELSGLVVGVAAAVTGAFGMNLVNHFEEHTSMFYQVSAGLVVFMAVMGYAVLRKLSMDSIL